MKYSIATKHSLYVFFKLKDKDHIHSRGINMRFLGALYNASENPLKDIVLEQIYSRDLKNSLRENLRNERGEYL
jgi:hypothetical protein